jgi:hypothetical protein
MASNTHLQTWHSVLQHLGCLLCDAATAKVGRVDEYRIVPHAILKGTQLGVGVVVHQAAVIDKAHLHVRPLEMVIVDLVRLQEQ